MEKTAAFNNAVLELNERIRIITEIAPAFKPQNAQKFATSFARYIFDNFPDNLANEISQWTADYPYDADKKKILRSVIYFLAAYKNVDIKRVSFKTVDPDEPDIVGGYVDGVFYLYNEFLHEPDFAVILGYLSHEIVHAFQDKYQTTLPKNVVESSKENYVSVKENEQVYNIDPREQEANAIEEIIKTKFNEQKGL